MQQTELVVGFSELKDLLIRTYEIEREREFVKLYFTEETDSLLMHDYDDHKKYLFLSFNVKKKIIVDRLSANAHRLVDEALRHPSPANFLNNEFKLSGFFRS